jgi:hypothetical protein
LILGQLLAAASYRAEGPDRVANRTSSPANEQWQIRLHIPGISLLSLVEDDLQAMRLIQP